MAKVEAEARNAVTILWRIENISYCENKKVLIKSDYFRVQALNNASFVLGLRQTVTKPSDTFMCFELSCHKGEVKYSINCECSILNSDGSPLITETFHNQFFKRKNSSIFLLQRRTQEVLQSEKCLFLPNDTLTVRLRICKSRESTLTEYISLLHKIEIEDVSFLWPIERFSELELNQEVFPRAYVYEYLHENPQKMELAILLEGKSLLDSKVKLKALLHSYAFVNIKVSVIGALQDMIYCKESQNISISSMDLNLIFPTSLSRENLLDESSGYLENDILTLRLNMICTYCTCSVTNHDLGSLNLYRFIPRNASKSTEVGRPQQKGELPKASKRSNNSLHVLKKDLLFMYQEQTFSDFELRSGDTSISVHKNVLSARSPVFRAMFSNDMKESESSFLDVPDMDTPTLNRFLTFLYTGTVDDLQWEGAAKLYYAADKYDVSSLRQLCTSTLHSSIALSNVCDILVLADRHQDQQLTSIVHDFILRDFEKVMHSKEWDSLMESDPILAGKITHQLFKKKYKAP